MKILRRHFELVAASVARTRQATQITGSARDKAAALSAVRLCAIDLAASLAATNSNFDRDRFLAACGFD